jgi:hypothetical protein
VLDHEQDTCAHATTVASTKSHMIRRLNDAFRKSGAGGVVAVTSGIKALGPDALAAIVNDIRFRAEFTADNDPYGEHDMGSLRHGSARVFWKIDYYDAELAYGSPDPSDPTVTTRVLTIMLAEEY